MIPTQELLGLYVGAPADEASGAPFDADATLRFVLFRDGDRNRWVSVYRFATNRGEDLIVRSGSFQRESAQSVACRIERVYREGWADLGRDPKSSSRRSHLSALLHCKPGSEGRWRFWVRWQQRSSHIERYVWREAVPTVLPADEEAWSLWARCER